MTGKRLGYIRTSTTDQNTARQLDGIPLDKIFTEQLSGKNRERPQLKLCIEFAREGDTLYVHALDRLGRNVRDLMDIVEELTNKGVTVTFMHPNLSFTGDGDSPINKLLFLLLAGFAEMERNLINERIREGVAVAKREGRYRGRSPAIRSSNGKAVEFESLLTQGAKVSEIARRLGVSRQTIYSQLKSRAASQNPQTEEVAA
jgi:DNA invertase Pin-like site-specific DNA recombinase